MSSNIHFIGQTCQSQLRVVKKRRIFYGEADRNMGRGGVFNPFGQPDCKKTVLFWTPLMRKKSRGIWTMIQGQRNHNLFIITRFLKNIFDTVWSKRRGQKCSGTKIQKMGGGASVDAELSFELLTDSFKASKIPYLAL